MQGTAALQLGKRLGITHASICVKPRRVLAAKDTLAINNNR